MLNTLIKVYSLIHNRLTLKHKFIRNKEIKKIEWKHYKSIFRAGAVFIEIK